MHIEVEFALEVVGSELAEAVLLSDGADIRLLAAIGLLSFIPGNDGREANLPHPREEGQRCEDQGRDEPLVFVQHSED